MYSIIDIEGSGGKYGQEKIIEIAIYKFDGTNIIDQFSSLVNPEKSIDFYVQKLTKISDKMVKRAPKFASIAKRIIELTEGTTLVAHNAEFDYRMLRQEYKELGYHFAIQTLDTVKLSQFLLPDQNSYSLSKISKSLGIPHLDKHRAYGDARVTLELFKILLSKDLGKQIIKKSIVQNELKVHSPKILGLLEDLPHRTGVYYLHNINGKIIFLNWAKDISNAIHHLFTSDEILAKKIQQKTNFISFEETGSKLLAQFKFWEEQKQLNPKLNQYLKEEPYHKQSIEFEEPNKIWTDVGRNPNETSYFVIREGKLKGYGFYQWNAQIESEKKLIQRMIPLTETERMKSKLQKYIERKKLKEANASHL